MGGELVIRPGVYFAAVQGEGILMDLIHDRYLGLSGASTIVWTGIASGKELGEIRSDLARALPNDPPAAVEKLLLDQVAAWRDSGLVGAVPLDSPELPKAHPNCAPSSLGLDVDRLSRTPASTMAYLRLTRAKRWTKRTVRRHGLCVLLKRMQRFGVSAIGWQLHREPAVYRMVHTYAVERRMLHQGRNDCLWRSVALSAALRWINVDAQVCFGVQKFPFEAHAWVEVGDHAVNERPASIHKYAVIARF